MHRTTYCLTATLPLMHDGENPEHEPIQVTLPSSPEFAALLSQHDSFLQCATRLVARSLLSPAGDLGYKLNACWWSAATQMQGELKKMQRVHTDPGKLQQGQRTKFVLEGA